MGWFNDARPSTGQKRRYGSRSAAHLAQDLPLAIMHGQRAGDAMTRKMLHEAEKPWQFASIDALFEQRQDERPCRCTKSEIAILNALGDAAKLDQLTDCVAMQQCHHIVV